MTDNNRSRSGSLQFYPRVRAKKTTPRVNWKPVSSQSPLQGFLGYKVGMISVWAKDNTPDSMTKGKRITVPATVIECPAMRIYSVRFYKDGKVLTETILSNEKELKRKVRTPKKAAKELAKTPDCDDVRVILYSLVKKTATDKKKPDLIEMALTGTIEEKIKFITEHLSKDILVTDVFKEGLVDVRGVTKGYGTKGPVKRFGIALKDHKSEKGRRRPGSLAPWHPARVTFRAPQAGQTGYHNRITYNNLILEVGSIDQKDINQKGGFEHYGRIKNDYIILRGSIPGPKKRGLVVTPAIRPSKNQSKKSFEVLELR